MFVEYQKRRMEFSELEKLKVIGTAIHRGITDLGIF
jgi:hypothetical protein